MNENKLKKAFGKIKKEMDSLTKEVKSMNKKISKTRNDSENNHLDIEMIDSRFAEFTELINEKISMQMASLKIEMEIEMMNTTVENQKKIEKTNPNSVNIEKKIDNTFSELNEILNEKINLDVSSLRMEITEEIAKLYDRFFNEIIEFRGELNKKGNTETKTVSKKTTKTTKKENPKETSKTIEVKKESKLKKVAKWLFVDEDEENEIADIKTEVKKK